MTKRQITKELERQATLFEEACKQGQVSIEKPTFEKYAAYVVELKERNGLKVKTAVRYKDKQRDRTIFFVSFLMFYSTFFSISLTLGHSLSTVLPCAPIGTVAEHVVRVTIGR